MKQKKKSKVRKAAAKHKGGCYCGAVRFVASGAPVKVLACHCQDCQHLSGSAFYVLAAYARKDVVITGRLKKFTSGNSVIRQFCPRRGSQVFGQRKHRLDFIAITLGSFENSDGLLPSDHIWVSDKQEWLSLPAKIKQHSKWPQA